MYFGFIILIVIHDFLKVNTEINNQVTLVDFPTSLTKVSVGATMRTDRRDKFVAIYIYVYTGRAILNAPGKYLPNYALFEKCFK